ncbi:hypothetical protein BDQ17DRAFT_1358549 [Cyathus striatus]|nr:hypothetical protein BDQ17DRAFT_1358549 [Cyathus striatus]
MTSLYDRTYTGNPELAWNLTEKPAQHYFIDFGISCRYSEGHSPSSSWLQRFQNSPTHTVIHLLWTCSV